MALARSRQAYFEIAQRLKTPAYRRDSVTRRSATKEVARAWAALDLPARATARVRSTNDTEIDVTRKLDDGLLDREIEQASGSEAVRQLRLKRLTVEANMAGAFARHVQLARALGVTVRTIERDAAALARGGIELHTLKRA